MKAIMEYWRSFTRKTKASVIVIVMAAFVFIGLAASSGRSTSDAPTITTRGIAKRIRNNGGGTLIPLTVVVRGFAWQEADWTPAWDKYMFGMSRTAYVDYAIDVSNLKSTDIAVEETSEGKREVTINLPAPIVDENTLRPPTQDKPIEFEHGKTYRQKTKDETRNAVLGKVNEAIAKVVEEQDVELKKNGQNICQ